MKKRILAIGLLVGLLIMTGCGNKDMWDTVRTYDKAVIVLGDEVITVDVKQWKDYDGEQIQIITEDGTVYLVSSYNCTLIRSKQQLQSRYRMIVFLINFTIVAVYIGWLIYDATEEE